MGIRVAIYVRLSNEDRDKNGSDESESIQNQKSLLKDYCSERNWEIYNIYNDEDYSGTDRTRPEFNKMIKDCESGKVNLVLCKSQDRFARDNELINHYIHDKFLEWDVRFVSVIDHIDNDNETTKKTSQITALTSEWYCEDTSQKVRSVLKNKRQNGQFTGSFAPYGYKIDPHNKNHLVIDENVAENVRLIFRMFAEGCGYRKIVQTLNDKCIPNPTSYKKMCGSKFVNCNIKGSCNQGKWTQSTIYKMLRNETYTGTLVQGKSHDVSYKNHKRKPVDEKDWIKVPHSHQPIIDDDLWNKVKQRTKSNTRASTVTQKVTPLAGKVRCAVCSSPMKRNVYYNKNKTKMYYNLQCGNYKNGSMNCRNKHCISGKQLEEFLLQQINQHIKEYCDTDEIQLKIRHQEKIQSLSQEIDLINQTITDKENKLTKMYDDYLNEIITAQQYKIISKSYSEQITDLNSKAETLENQLQHYKQFSEQTVDKKSLIRKYIDVKVLTREIVEDFIETIYIGEKNGDNRTIKVIWKI